ncbi:MAG: hypothetical protein ACR2L8_05050 [Solirubrobacteraceae bacterium]
MGSIQIRNVPGDVHRTPKARAAIEGTSPSEPVLREVTRAARTATPDELDERIRARGSTGVRTADILDARDAGRRS